MPATAKQPEVKKYPKLRFPGFSSEWEEKKLGDLTRIYDGTHQTPDYVKKGIPFYSVEHLTANNFSDTKFIAEDVFNKENKRISLEKNDILMTRIGDIGTARLIDWDVKASFYVSLALIKKSKKVVSHFLSQYIGTANFQKELWKRTIHVAFPKKINLGEIGECKLFTPLIPEQQKIADFLETVDKWIENLRSQKKSFAAYKKGMMQKIFAQEICFKDENGKDFPEWEEKRLGDFFDITSSKRVFENEWTTSGVPFYRAREIVKLSKNGYVNNELFISTEMFEKYKNMYGAPQENDILVTGVGTIGIVYVVKKSDRFYFKDGNIVWFKSLNLINSQFVRHLFNTRGIRKKILDNASITTVGTFTIDSAKKMKITIPTLQEQQKISDSLSSLDNLIESKQQQITQAENWKRGLMQGLFV